MDRQNPDSNNPNSIFMLKYLHLPVELASPQKTSLADLWTWTSLDMAVDDWPHPTTSNNISNFILLMPISIKKSKILSDSILSRDIDNQISN